MKVFLTLLLVLSGSFLCLDLASAADNDIIISEIGAYESLNNEWIEIYNRGSDPVDLTGWKFFENDTNHGLSLYQGADMIINSGEYAIIADVADNFVLNWPNFSGTIIDSSWSTLNEGGELIELRTSSDPVSVIESFTYIPAGDFSLERLDLTLDDYSSSNWQEHQSGGTPGSQNSGGQGDDPDESESDPPSAGNHYSPSRPNYDPSAVVINELMIDPKGDQEEWIELFNNTGRSINLMDWVLEDGSERVTEISGVIMAHSFLVVGELNGRLNNDGDMIRLMDSSSRVIDSVTYGIWDDGKVSDNAPTAIDSGSLSRIKDGVDTDKDIDDFLVAPRATKSTVNSFEETEYDLPKIIINELFPNPVGSDLESEFIELKNNDDVEIDLANWWLIDSSGKNHILFVKLLPEEYLSIERSVSGIALNNSGEEIVRLYYPNGLLVDLVSYSGEVIGDFSYSLDEDTWQWSELATSGAENIIQVANRPPIAHIEADYDWLLLNESVVLDASDSYDLEDVELSYLWDLGDGVTSTDVVLDYQYKEAGSYDITLMVTDSEELEGMTQFSVVVGSLEVGIVDGQVIISEFLPNPVGEELNGEWIELFGVGTEPINLNGWVLDDIEGGSKPFQIEGATIYPGEYVVFSRSVTGIALNNDNDTVRLINSSGVLIDSVDYSGAKSGYSYAYDDLYGFKWTDSPTPSLANVIGVTLGPNLVSNINISLAEVRSLEVGSQVTVEGVVSVEPGLLGTQVFYLDGSGVQIYCYSKDFPDLLVGDMIRVSGEISEAGGETRIKIKGSENIEMIMSGGEIPIPEEVEISDINEDTEGHLVKVSGEVIEKKGSSIYLDDGNEEIKVYIKKSTGIDIGGINEGSKLTVIGIVSETKSGYRLLPRYQSDIIGGEVLGIQEGVDFDNTGASSSSELNKYLVATIIFLVIVISWLGFNQWRVKKK